MSKFTVNLIKFNKILIITILFFLCFDFILGKFIYKKFLRKNFIDIYNFVYVDNNVYDHTLDKNLDVITGNIRYRLCTDNNGFRVFCNNISNQKKKYEIAIIGDSFTEGVGLNYEETFVGIFSEKIGKEKVANLGVVSYSPSIYYLKLKELINKGYKFQEVIIFIDLSDLVDETSCYKFSKNAIIRRENFNSCINLGIEFFDKKYLNFFNKNLKLSYQSFVIFQKFLLKKNIIKKKPNSFQLNTPRSSWTYNYKKNLYNNYSLEEAKKLMIDKIELLYDLLKVNNIKMSIAVYPWPNTIYYDNSKNIYTEMWKNFCIGKCKNFYDFNNIFFDQLKTLSKDEVIIKNFLEEDIHYNAFASKLIAIDLYKKYIELNN